MKNILRLFGSDLKRLVRNIFVCVIAGGLCVIPSLYAWFNIYSNWDPYANTANIKVAVATTDKGYTMDDGTTQNMGDEVIEELKENTKIGWTFTNADDALAGVYDGRYYAAIVIKENFTESMVNVFDEESSDPTILYYENEKKNAVATKITDSAASTLKQSINEKYIEVLSETLFSETNDLASALQDNNMLETFESQLTSANANLQAYNNLITMVLSSNNALKELADQANTRADAAQKDIASGKADIDTAGATIDALDAGRTSISDFADNTEANLDAIQGSINTVSDDVDAIMNAGTLEDAQKAVLQGITDAAAFESQLAGLSDILDKILNDVNATEEERAAAQELKDTLDEMRGSASSVLDELKDSGISKEDLAKALAEAGYSEDEIKQALEEAGATEEEIDEILNEISDAIDTVSGNAAKAKSHFETVSGNAAAFGSYVESVSGNDASFTKPASLDSIKSALSGASDAMDTLQTKYDSSLKPQAQAAEEKIRDLMKDAQGALDNLSTSFESLGTVLDDADLTIDAGQTTLEELQTALTLTSARITDIVAEMNKLNDNDKVQLLTKFLSGDPKTYGKFFASPVDVTTKEIYPIANYGSAMTPFYTILCLWVGALILTALIKVKADPDVVPGATHTQLFFGRYLLFFALGQIQMLIAVFGDIYLLKCQVIHRGMFLLTASVTSFVFTLLIYALTISFGDIGKALAVVIMVIQIAGSGGTYPIELLPEVYRKIYIFFPFPYAINAMREAVAGCYGDTYRDNMLRLLIFAVAALAIGLFIRIPFMGINHYMEKRMEDTKLM